VLHGAFLVEVGSLFQYEKSDGGCEHCRTYEESDDDSARSRFSCEHCAGADGPEQQNGSDQAGREAAALQDEREDVHEGAVDQHERWKAESNGRKFGRDFDSNDSHNDDETVGDVEVFPSRGKVKNLARPVAPVENELLEDVESIGSDAKPEHDLKMGHGVRLTALPSKLERISKDAADFIRRSRGGCKR
jgi:hypothetical protein